VKIAGPLKAHRDGARSFYVRDPDGVLVQIIYHPPIADRAKR
jgi:catechol 2,3-dioxygenase-like lactoylglutathione lyase family enzyme